MATAGGLYVHSDSGAPAGCDDYTTLIIVHGYVWHAGTFAKLQPLAATHGVRIIALNRREYPGSVPYTAEERALLPPVPDEPLTDVAQIRSNQQMLQMFMRDRGYELYQSIEGLVVEHNLPAASQTGGIVLVGWSLGATWMMSLLKHIAEFPIGAVNLRDYVRRVILSDPPSCLLGYPYPAQDPWNPFFDTSLTYEERGQVFTNWITSYFAHGPTLDTYERRHALQTPPSTIAAQTKEDFEATVHVPPGVPGGSDWTLLHGCAAYGVYGTLREGALFLSQPDDSGEKTIGDEWRDVELRYVWGDQSVWEVPYAAQLLRQEVADGAREGKPIRKFTSLCVKGTNHFAQWDAPERTLQAFLAEPQGCDA
ncbi:uncharacterized protein TRAVEDRAFT_64846 [Trametes versicolor FP-101664 SS1]|uniref:uncharacterized protein n=1 Tax=Trametes versicolor (strain FP-101664) TaxID=717944 RepID=UPI0004621B32|nr:uncharacterized protein TRAVEDRAFT_64846 [Trametes versicolor FP-101664 SS1]EIW58385.1 hypothetical protein TRAVEDRAFT_64846 [Trametes versicolor FP-101664 SS1]